MTTTFSLAAGVAMYTLPVSDSLCGVTHRIVGIMALLSDVSKMMLHGRGEILNFGLGAIKVFLWQAA